MWAAAAAAPFSSILSHSHSIQAHFSSLSFPEDVTSTLKVPLFSLCAADSGVSSVLQTDDLIGQQNGNYQSLPEPISSGQMISSPPALADHQTPASDESLLQAANQGLEAAYQQAATQLHPGAYQQSTTQLHQGPYQSQTVSLPDRSLFSYSSHLVRTISVTSFLFFFFLLCFFV